MKRFKVIYAYRVLFEIHWIESWFSLTYESIISMCFLSRRKSFSRERTIGSNCCPLSTSKVHNWDPHWFFSFFPIPLDRYQFSMEFTQLIDSTHYLTNDLANIICTFHISWLYAAYVDVSVVVYAFSSFRNYFVRFTVFVDNTIGCR